MLCSGSVDAAERGTASVYAHKFHGRRTASGERLNTHTLTCAHRRHPFGTMLKVSSGRRFIVCRCNDRGPFVRGRIVDLTPAGARALGMSGLARVIVERM
jgi:rare lipoprotein A